MGSKYTSGVLLLSFYLAGTTLATAQGKPLQSGSARSLDQAFQAAAAEYDAGNYAEATLHLKALLPSAPRSFELHELLGLAYAAQSRDAESVAELKAAVELKPDSAAARTNLATGLAHMGDYTAAEAQCRKALALEPHNYVANHDLAELYLRSDRVADALPLLKEAQRERPAAYDNGYDLALAYLMTAKLEDAAQLVDALAEQKDTGELHTLRGRIDEKQGRFVEAANEFATAAHMEPSEDNLFAWASELLLHRTYEPAIDVFRQGTRLYPNSPRLFIGLGMALYSLSQYEESVRSLLTAADLSPHDARCYLFLSRAYLSSPDQAHDVIERFHRYAELEPGNARAQYYYAVSLWKGKRLEDPDVDYHTVEALLQKSIVLDPTLADAHLQLGILYNDQHEYARALPEYERALQLNPDLSDAHFRLGKYYVHAGEQAKAQSEFDLFKKLQAQHQAQVDKGRAEVQQFVVSSMAAAPGRP